MRQSDRREKGGDVQRVLWPLVSVDLQTRQSALHVLVDLATLSICRLHASVWVSQSECHDVDQALGQLPIG